MTTHNNDVTAHYAKVLKGWPVKFAGPAPTADQLTLAHAFGRPGKQSLALAMALREGGATNAQIQVACGAPQNNHRRGLIEGKYLKREATGNDDRGHTVYKVTLTPKGTAAVAKANERAALAAAGGDAPVKAKRKANRHTRRAARKAAPGTGTQPAVTSDAPPVSEAPPVDGATPQGDAQQ